MESFLDITQPPSRPLVAASILSADFGRMADECRAVLEGGADLLVMGAYTHSRMRQLILGGVTKHVLAEAAIPLLMIH